MQRRIWISTFLLTGLFAVISTASNGQEAIGSTTSVKPQAEANTRTLSNGSSVYSKELIRTGDSGVASLRFHDNSNLSVGPKSSVRLDKFVYDPNKSIGSVAVEAAAAPYDLLPARRTTGPTRSRPLWDAWHWRLNAPARSISWRVLPSLPGVERGTLTGGGT
jgi:hypothetical protein